MSVNSRRRAAKLDTASDEFHEKTSLIVGLLSGITAALVGKSDGRGFGFIGTIEHAQPNGNDLRFWYSDRRSTGAATRGGPNPTQAVKTAQAAHAAQRNHQAH